jgi:hypothetical protein
LAGEYRAENSDLNARAVVFYLPAMIPISVRKTGLFGLRNGYWSDKLLKPSAGIVVYQLILFNALFISSWSDLRQLKF